MGCQHILPVGWTRWLGRLQERIQFFIEFLELPFRHKGIVIITIRIDGEGAENKICKVLSIIPEKNVWIIVREWRSCRGALINSYTRVSISPRIRYVGVNAESMYLLWNRLGDNDFWCTSDCCCCSSGWMEVIGIVVVMGEDGGVGIWKFSENGTEDGVGMDTFGIESVGMGSKVAAVSSTSFWTVAPP